MQSRLLFIVSLIFFATSLLLAAGCSRDSAPVSTEVNAPQQQQLNANDVAFHPTLKDRSYDATIRDIVTREDPTVDGWDSEAFNELANAQLKKVGERIANTSSTESTALCASDFASNHLRPVELDASFDGPKFKVRRAADGTNSEMQHNGVEGFDQAIDGLSAAFVDTTEKHFKFKVIRVQLDGDQAKTRSYFQMTGTSPSGKRVQANSTWDCAWTTDGTTTDGTYPKLKKILVSNYEEVQAADNVTAFSDCTQAAFAGTNALEQQLIYGRDHWYANLEATIGIEGRGNGIAIGDANGDGMDDIYVCQPAALPNRLFVRNPDGTMSDQSKAAGVDWLDSTRGALFVDIDNDSDQDLIVSLSTRIMLHENIGDGTFRTATEFATESRLFSINAVDYDNDGDLDLFVCGYSSEGQTRAEDIFTSPVPYHDARNGAANFLFRNDGEGFTDVTEATGLDQNSSRFSLASAWEDYDNDGDLDLYVANDFGRNNLYRNDAGAAPEERTFVDVAAEAGVEDIGPGMSAVWGDANNDGLADLYVSNMFSSAGSRITHQQQFKPGAKSTDVEGFRRHARGNSLFINQGNGTFADKAIDSATVMGRWAWGSLFVDLNNDGWKDIYVTNGFVTADNNNDL